MIASNSRGQIRQSGRNSAISRIALHLHIQVAILAENQTP
jgi:hypothetical protein